MKKYGNRFPKGSVPGRGDRIPPYRLGTSEKATEEQKEESYDTTVAGRNAVRELLNSGRDIDKIFVAKGDREGSIVQLIAEATARQIPVLECERKKLDLLAGEVRHQGIVAMAAERNYSTIDEMIAVAEARGEAPFLCIADGVEDPHNLGAILRSAECAGVHGVLIPKRRSAGLSATVAKSSAGAIEHIRIAKVSNLNAAVEDLKKRGFWIYAADMDGTPYYETDMTGRMAVVLGSEGFGISRLLKENCDFTLSIPMYGSVNSLNVSNAASILFFEAAKQRHKK